MQYVLMVIFVCKLSKYKLKAYSLSISSFEENGWVQVFKILLLCSKEEEQ